MADISIAIQHTPGQVARHVCVRAMLDQLRWEDPTVSVTVVADKKREGCWPSHRRALQTAGEARHHLVLQDDVALCRDFIRSVEAALATRPANLITLYTNSNVVFTARARRESWLEVPGVSGVATVWPRDLIAEFLAWEEAHIDRTLKWDDVRVSMWLIKTSRNAFATVPSLIQHLGGGRSTLGLNGRSKVAAWYVGAQRSGLDIDWSRGLTSPTKASSRLRAEWWQYFQE